MMHSPVSTTRRGSNLAESAAPRGDTTTIVTANGSVAKPAFER